VCCCIFWIEFYGFFVVIFCLISLTQIGEKVAVIAMRFGIVGI